MKKRNITEQEALLSLFSKDKVLLESSFKTLIDEIYERLDEEDLVSFLKDGNYLTEDMVKDLDLSDTELAKELQDALALKADKSDLTDLDGRVTVNEGSILAINGELELLRDLISDENGDFDLSLLDFKANKDEVDAALLLKADKTDLDEKADKSDVEAALLLKADKTDLDEKVSQEDLDDAIENLTGTLLEEANDTIKDLEAKISTLSASLLALEAKFNDYYTKEEADNLPAKVG